MIIIRFLVIFFRKVWRLEVDINRRRLFYWMTVVMQYILALKDQDLRFFYSGSPYVAILWKACFANVPVNVLSVIYDLEFVLFPNIHIGNPSDLLHAQEMFGMRKELHPWKLDGLVFLDILYFFKRAEIPKFDHPLASEGQYCVWGAKIQR